MEELIWKECRCVFSLPHAQWPIAGSPAWVIVEAVDMPMVKMRSKWGGQSMWVTAAIILKIEEV